MKTIEVLYKATVIVCALAGFAVLLTLNWDQLFLGWPSALLLALIAGLSIALAKVTGGVISTVVHMATYRKHGK